MAHVAFEVDNLTEALAGQEVIIPPNSPSFVALYRMQVEERALKDTFGDEYIAYARTAKRLIPRLY